MLFFSGLKIMKITKTILLVFFVALIDVSNVFAAEEPPKPNAKAADGPPVVIDGPIDQNIMFLLICGLFLGMYSIYRYNVNKKASM